MLAIGSDHGGFDLKQLILEKLRQDGIEVEDCGCDTPDSVDYPIIAKRVTDAIITGRCEKGILICGTGIGMSIAANKAKGIRAANCENPYSARMAREHNNAQILCIGARVVGPEVALMMVEEFLKAEHAGGRHSRRIQLIEEMEKHEQ